MSQQFSHARIKHLYSRVDLTKPLNFSFDSKTYIGYQGVNIDCYMVV